MCSCGINKKKIVEKFNQKQVQTNSRRKKLNKKHNMCPTNKKYCSLKTRYYEWKHYTPEWIQ
jgi:hypothetical protein